MLMSHRTHYRRAKRAGAKNAPRLPQKGEIPKDSLCKTRFSRRPKGAGGKFAFGLPQKAESLLHPFVNADQATLDKPWSPWIESSGKRDVSFSPNMWGPTEFNWKR